MRVIRDGNTSEAFHFTGLLTDVGENRPTLGKDNNSDLIGIPHTQLIPPVTVHRPVPVPFPVL